MGKGAWKDNLQGQDPRDTGPEQPPKRQGIDLRVHRMLTVGQRKPQASNPWVRAGDK